jgi:hypothetical protein
MLTNLAERKTFYPIPDEEGSGNRSGSRGATAPVALPYRYYTNTVKRLETSLSRTQQISPRGCSTVTIIHNMNVLL